MSVIQASDPPHTCTPSDLRYMEYLYADVGQPSKPY